MSAVTVLPGASAWNPGVMGIPQVPGQTFVRSRIGDSYDEIGGGVNDPTPDLPASSDIVSGFVMAEPTVLRALRATQSRVGVLPSNLSTGQAISKRIEEIPLNPYPSLVNVGVSGLVNVGVSDENHDYSINVLAKLSSGFSSSLLLALVTSESFLEHRSILMLIPVSISGFILLISSGIPFVESRKHTATDAVTSLEGVGWGASVYWGLSNFLTGFGLGLVATPLAGILGPIRHVVKRYRQRKTLFDGLHVLQEIAKDPEAMNKLFREHPEIFEEFAFKWVPQTIEAHRDKLLAERATLQEQLAGFERDIKWMQDQDQTQDPDVIKAGKKSLLRTQGEIQIRLQHIERALPLSEQKLVSIQKWQEDIRPTLEEWKKTRQLEEQAIRDKLRQEKEVRMVTTELLARVEKAAEVRQSLVSATEGEIASQRVVLRVDDTVRQSDDVTTGIAARVEVEGELSVEEEDTEANKRKV